MLRLANAHKSYDLTIKVNDQPVKLTVRSMTLMERTDLVNNLTESPEGPGGLKGLMKMLEKIIVRFAEFPDKEPAEVINQLEHFRDVNEIAKGVIEWAFLPESESKNLFSSPEQSTPESAGNAETNAGAEIEHV